MKVIGNTILMTFMNININMGMCSRQVLHTQNGNITLYIGGGSNVFVEPIKRTKVKKIKLYNFFKVNLYFYLAT